VTYLTEQCKNASSEQYNKKKLKKNKKNIKKVVAGEELQMDVMQSITNLIIYSKQTVERTEIKKLSDNTILF
jgi:hypothetical protein